MYKEYTRGQGPSVLEGLAGMVRQADADVIVSAEYNHSVPPTLSNLRDHFLEEYFFKPSATAPARRGIASSTSWSGTRELSGWRDPWECPTDKRSGTQKHPATGITRVYA
jgi:NAD(P)H-dependent FMN reductase